MNVRRYKYAMFGVALLLAGSAFADEFVVTNSAPTSATGAPPLIEIVVYDGATLPATVVAGCSEVDCMGYAGPLTGTVTHPKNNVGWSVAGGNSRGSIYLYVDGQKVTSARSTKLLVWSGASAGSHVLQAMAYSPDGVAGWSTPLTITAQ